MKKFFHQMAALVFAAILSLSCLAVPAFADPGAIHAIDVTAELDRQGNAKISEIWDVTVPDDWTELYTVKGNLGDMEIRNFRAEDLDSGTKYTSLGNSWNVDASRADKTGRCGIHEASGGNLELCWGVGSSGRHRYKISYEMTKAVKAYKDGVDGFNIRFVNADLSSNPEQVRVTITGPKAFTQENTRMWAFGLKGTISLQDGSIVAQSTGAVNYCNILARFNDGLFTPVSQSKKKFSKVQKKAMKGSDYEDGQGLTGMEIFGIGALIAIVVFSVLSITGKKGDGIELDKETKAQLKDPPYSRVLPYDGSLTESYYVLKAVESHVPDSRIMSAYLLRWFQEGVLRAQKEESGRRSLLFGEKTKVSIVLGEKPETLSDPEEKLWMLFNLAAGTNNILEEDELYSWSKAHYESVESFYDAVKQEAETLAEEKKDTGLVRRRVLLTHQEVPGLTEQGAKRAVAMMGFKKYLKDFTIINERQARDVGLWKDYLVFASLFGIADEVAKEFKDILPGYFTAPAEEGAATAAGWEAAQLPVYLNTIDHVSTAAHSGYTDGMPSSSASSGLGGGTSFGGGGGFSGGGFGGGGR